MAYVVIACFLRVFYHFFNKIDFGVIEMLCFYWFYVC